MSDQLRISYSLAMLWEKGLWDDAVGQYFGLKNITTPQMEMGKEMHQKTADYITANGKLPEYLGGGILLPQPMVEEKYVIKLEDWLAISLVIDLENGQQLCEHKFGKTPAGVWAETYQLPTYRALLRIATGRNKDYGIVRRHNPANGDLDSAYVWFSDELERQAINWLMTIASEMHNYFQSNGFYKKYGAQREKMLAERGDRGLYVDLTEPVIENEH